jgi:hypothetical protein
MRSTGLVFLACVGLAATAACSDVSAPGSQENPLTDSLVTADVAATAGDAIASSVDNMIGNEVSVGFSVSAGGALFDAQSPRDLNVTRSRVCYDGNGAVQDRCDAQTTDSIVFSLIVNGTRTGSRTRGADTASFSVTVHRTAQLTVTGLLGSETTRIHNGTGASNDTSSFTGTAATRTLAESAGDSVINIVFNLPRASNPWPISGSIVRNSTITETMTVRDSTRTRTGTRRAVVTFPADAQGNVSLVVNGNTCSLNLVTHKVICPSTTS